MSDTGREGAALGAIGVPDPHTIYTPRCTSSNNTYRK